MERHLAIWGIFATIIIGGVAVMLTNNAVAGIALIVIAVIWLVIGYWVFIIRKRRKSDDKGIQVWVSPAPQPQTSLKRITFIERIKRWVIRRYGG